MWNLITNVFWSFFAQVVYKNTSRDFTVFLVLTSKFGFLKIFNVYFSFFAQVVYKNTSRDFIVLLVFTPTFGFFMIFSDFGHFSLKSFTRTPDDY